MQSLSLLSTLNTAMGVVIVNDWSSLRTAVQFDNAVIDVQANIIVQAQMNISSGYTITLMSSTKSTLDCNSTMRAPSNENVPAPRKRQFLRDRSHLHTLSR